jgi:hypothetical protein
VSVVFLCPACDEVHLARVRAASRLQFEHFNPHLGKTLERCARSGEWVSCHADDRRWCDAAPERPDPPRRR